MMDKRQQSRWRRAVALAGLISVLCFWTASVTHVHDLTRQSSIQQDCQLCVASNINHTLQSSTLVAAIFPPLFAQSLFLDECFLNNPERQLFHSRAPPAHA